MACAIRDLRLSFFLRAVHHVSALKPSTRVHRFSTIAVRTYMPLTHTNPHPRIPHLRPVQKKKSKQGTERMTMLQRRAKDMKQKSKMNPLTKLSVEGRGL